MKALVFACLAVAASLFARPAAAHSDPEREMPGATATIVVAPRPLVRYLINNLQLPDQQALAVEQALKAHPLKTSSPEELAEVLRPVLTAEQFARLQALKPANELSDELRYLATLH
jgi:hypothetical protein